MKFKKIKKLFTFFFVLVRLVIVALFLVYVPNRFIKLLPSWFFNHYENTDGLYKIDIQKNLLTIEWVKSQFEFSPELISGVSDAVTFVRDAAKEALDFKCANQKIIALNPTLSALKDIDQAGEIGNTEIWVSDETLYQKYIEDGWPTRFICNEKYKNSKIDYHNRLTYSVSDVLVESDKGRALSFVHFIGPVGFHALVLMQAGTNSKIFGWNQYIENSMKKITFLRRIRLSTGGASLHLLVNRWNFWSNLVYRIDHRHIQRNLCNFWLMKEIKTKYPQIQVIGEITWASEVSKLYKRWPLIVSR